MTLAAKLETIKKGFEGQAPAEVLEVLHGATQALVDSGAADRALGVGDTAYPFDLPGANGGRGKLSDLIADGPLVVTFFRGHW